MSQSQTERSKLERRLDTAFQTYIRARDGQCVQCGMTVTLTAGHVITRARINTRWDERNCFGQCLEHNNVHTYAPKIYTDWFIGKFGYESWAVLLRDSRQVASFADSDLEEMIIAFRRKTRELRKAA